MASKKKSAKVKKLLAKKKSVRAAVPKKPASSAKRKSAPIAKSKPIKFSVKKSAKPAKTTPSKKPTKPVKTTPSKRPTKPAKTTLSKKPTKPVKTTPSKRPTKATKAVKPVKAAKAIKNSATKPVAPTKAPAKTKPAAKPASPPPPVMSKSSLKSAKPAAAAALAASAATKPKIAGKGAARDLLRSRILGRTKATAKAGKPISFSLDEVKEIARRVGHSTEKKSAEKSAAKSATTRAAALAPAGPSKPNHIGAASLAEILGFIPGKTVRPADDESVIPEKFKRYYKLLIELRNHLTGQLDTHTEETLKRSSKDDSGDLSSYGQHMADSGTDTFDRDFALSLVSSEQEALSEVESAIRRIKQGTYGVCEITGKPITRERLLAVPFTRNSAEAQKELERNRYHVRTQAGLFGEMGGEGAKIANDSDDD